MEETLRVGELGIIRICKLSRADIDMVILHGNKKRIKVTAQDGIYLDKSRSLVCLLELVNARKVMSQSGIFKFMETKFFHIIQF